VRPMSPTSQPSTTNLRWVKHTRASLLTVDSLQFRIGGIGSDEQGSGEHACPL
jgi:hypothetical protein